MMNAQAFCAVGAERALSNELRKLGLPVIEGGFGKVRFQAGTEGLYRALMGLRTADRVLLEAGSFPAEDFDGLFEGTRAIPWEELIPPEKGLVVVKVRSARSHLKAETSIQGVIHKAAAERLCEIQGLLRLPEGGTPAEIRAHLDKDRVSLLLDLSGEPLFKRGYRTEGGIAPLRETTAAALILLAGWRRKFPLWDPFCGSGTIIIEAALYAWDLAPALGRSFALSELLIGDRGREAAVRKELAERADLSRPLWITGSDADGRVLRAAQANLERASRLAQGSSPGPKAAREKGKVPAFPRFVALPMEEARPPGDGEQGPPGEEGFIITNPPYGRRLGDPAQAEGSYRAMGRLGRAFPRWKLAVITDHPGFESFFGKKADSCREITNGALSSYFYQYHRL
jgi:putative N6-adenine-specific DNA methylase